ncbi:MAG TPA: phosphatase PAP2 family protein [Terriglobales bacterium]|nr:phosphatase PAP2 family protein [Terriglobales bacterium]
MPVDYFAGDNPISPAKPRALSPMAWETWKSSNIQSKLLHLAICALWIAFFLLAGRALDLSVPYLPLAIAGGLIFYLRNWPSKLELAAWILMSAGFAVIVRFPHDHNWINTSSGVLALFGLGAFLMLGLRWLWSDTDARRRTYAMLAPAAALVFFVLSAQRALSFANLLYPKTYDLYLYLVDGSLGFQPSFLMGRAMAHSAILRLAAQVTYVSLPFVMALVYALRLPKQSERPSWDMITLFLLAGLGGWALYNIVPATGPGYVFSASFPWETLPYPSLHRLLLERIPVNGNIPRNAIPSLHMAWVMLLYWNTKRQSPAMRYFLAVYLALTVVSTLGTGEHYFVDLVAGVPLAFAVQAIVAPDTRPSIWRRAAAASSGLGLTLFWLLLVRFCAKWMLISPIAPWGLVIATGVAIWRVKRWFESRSTTDSTQPQNSEAKAMATAAG